MPYTIVPERRGLGLQSSGGVERGGGGDGAPWATATKNVKKINLQDKH